MPDPHELDRVPQVVRFDDLGSPDAGDALPVARFDDLGADGPTETGGFADGGPAAARLGSTSWDGSGESHPAGHDNSGTTDTAAEAAPAEVRVADLTDLGSAGRGRADGARRAAGAERADGARPEAGTPRGTGTPRDAGTGPDRTGAVSAAGRRSSGPRGASSAGRNGRTALSGAGGSTSAATARADDEQSDPVAVAKAICLRLLSDRSRSKQELAQALRRKGIPDEAAAAALERFGEVGLVDDAAFAGQWVRSRHIHRGLGRRAIAVELRRKGVDSETAGEALAEVDDESEERRARALVDRKLRTRSGTPDEATARRLLGMLARKGYPAGIAYRVVKAALAEHAAELAEQIPGDDD